MKEKQIVTTTPTIEGKQIVEYKGIVFGEATFGSGWGTDIKGLVAAITEERTDGYENKFYETRTAALEQMQNHAADCGANAVVGVDVDYEFIDTILMVSASGTAVIVK
ncbi:YbjQ family protein [Verrucomicrobiota bacterium]